MRDNYHERITFTGKNMFKGRVKNSSNNTVALYDRKYIIYRYECVFTLGPIWEEVQCKKQWIFARPFWSSFI